MQPHSSTDVPVLLIGPANALHVVGAPWRWCRNTARELGVQLVGTRRRQLIPAGEFLAALRARPEADKPEPIDPAEQVRRALGRRRR